ncbi:MAG: hypothetical protein U0L10_13715, partial [Lachnospiraceae bacterium]|nr:hypothetical protein [Lachnospiraceae bacterium]
VRQSQNQSQKQPEHSAKKQTNIQKPAAMACTYTNTGPQWQAHTQTPAAFAGTASITEKQGKTAAHKQE